MKCCYICNKYIWPWQYNVKIYVKKHEDVHLTCIILKIFDEQMLELEKSRWESEGGFIKINPDKSEYIKND